jgi:hypothetical protein
MMTQTRLKELLDYDPLTGVFTWKVRRGKMRAGSRAGSPHAEGYWEIRLDGKAYLAHRLAWLSVHGAMPLKIDHRDRNRSNNILTNLRAATSSQNGANAPAPKNNTSGHKGVYKGKDGWYVRVKKNRRPVSGGSYKDFETACSAQETLERRLQGEFACVV